MELMLAKETPAIEIREYFEGILRMEQSNDPYPADMDDVWHLAHKNRKHAVDALAKYFLKDFDYIVLPPPKWGANRTGWPQQKNL